MLYLKYSVTYIQCPQLAVLNTYSAKYVRHLNKVIVIIIVIVIAIAIVIVIYRA